MMQNSDLTCSQLPLTTIGVVGAGTMGSAITQHFIMKGLDVILVDQNDDCLLRGVGHIKQSLAEAKQRRLISEQQYDAMLANLVTSTNKTDLAQCELVVEAIFEDLKVKQSLFKELESIVSPDCILASNTSSFLVADIAKNLQYPQRVIGVHYFYHAAKNKLVEVIPSAQTAKKISTTLMSFYQYIDKTPIQVKDVAGFAVNRFFVPWLNEAVRLLEQGYGSIKVIDEVSCQVFGVGMGPFALMNATGVAIAQHAAQGLADKLGGFYAPAALLISQVDAKKDWDLSDQQLLNQPITEAENNTDNITIITERMVGATLGIAAQMISEGVVDATSADLGARSGLRWPMGPFELMNKLGVVAVKEMVSKIFSTWDMPLPPFPVNSHQQSTMIDKIQLNWVTHFVCKRAGFIQFNLPDRMNPLGEQTMQQLNSCIDALNNNADIDKIFIFGCGKAFVAGADIKLFLDAIDSDNFERIQLFTEFGQQVFNKISRSTKTTYAYLDGLALGGGFELALACDHRIATHKTVIAFPETGIGIYPGLGGTQRTTRLVGMGAAKYLIATGQFINGDKAYQLGLVDEVITPVFTIEQLANYQLDQAQAGSDEKALAEIDFANFDGELNEQLLSESKYKLAEKQLRRKAPLAMKMAMNLISAASNVGFEQGLGLELAGLKTVFSSQDAKTGLSSILTGKKPEFIGA